MVITKLLGQIMMMPDWFIIIMVLLKYLEFYLIHLVQIILKIYISNNNVKRIYYCVGVILMMGVTLS